MIIRRAEIGDGIAIAEIYNAYLGVATMDTDAMTLDIAVTLINSQIESEHIHVIQDEDNVIGWGRIKRYSERYGYSYTAETSVYIQQQHIGKGVGTELKQHIIGHCRRLGYHHLVAKVLADNKASIKYNEKLGYERVGVQKEVGYLNGRWVDVVIMQLLL